eukprot:evm.model.NODE_19601_length_21504_cov_34.674339.5
MKTIPALLMVLEAVVVLLLLVIGAGIVLLLPSMPTEAAGLAVAVMVLGEKSSGTGGPALPSRLRSNVVVADSSSCCSKSKSKERMVLPGRGRDDEAGGGWGRGGDGENGVEDTIAGELVVWLVQ